MKTRTHSRTKRFPAPHEDHRDDPLALLLEEVEDTPSSEYIVTLQAQELPALHEYLLELGSRTIH
jgi:hypothetical protein